MKRVLVSFLAILYLAAGVGFTLREHYCMGEMIGASIQHAEHASGEHRCDRCGMEKKSSDNGCCKDKVKTFKSSPDQLIAKALSFSAPLVFALPPAQFQFPVQQSVSIIAAIPAAPAHGPPLRTSVPIYLQVRCIRI